MDYQRRDLGDMSFIDRQGKLVQPSREDHHAKKPAKAGKAYAFFDCNASKKEIEDTMPEIRKDAETPSELELSLIEGPSNLNGDAELLEIAENAKNSGVRYVIEATYPGKSNRKTADKLVTLMNQTYQSPLYQHGEPFTGEVTYEENGEYLFF